MEGFSYLPHDKYCIINEDDPVIRQVVLRLPDPPPLELIDGYGLDPVDQKFRRKVTPLKLQLIEKRARKKIEEYVDSGINNRANGYHVQKEFWRIIEDEKDSLKEEIKWVKDNWWYLTNGYWFFCHGKPTWISPWYFFFLNFYYIEEAALYPEYRDRDRRAELAAWYAYTCTESFKDVDDKGNALSMEMIDYGNRLFYGLAEPKRRRGGATARSLAHGLWILISEESVYCDIVADVGKHAKGIFDEKLSPAWYHLPLWIKPVWDGEERPSRSISLMHPKTVMKERCLGSEFGFTESSAERANDSRRLGYLLSDEEGKGASRADVKRRWGINMLTMSQMDRIHGYSDHPSTVEEMVEGGAEFRTMCEQMSDFYVRNSVGQTLSGLWYIFFKAEDGADNYIDAWGNSVMYDPTEEQIKYAPEGSSFTIRKMGAKRYLDSTLEALINDGSFDKLKEYREKLRRNPRVSSDCWKGAAGDMGWNIIKIDKAIVDSKDKKVYRGNFYWAERDKKVAWMDDPNGRWSVSDFLIGRTNRWKNGFSYHQDPATGKFMIAKCPSSLTVGTIGLDPFRSRTATQAKSKEYGENTNLSDGGIAVYLNPDSALNGSLPENEWPTPKFICTYRYRANQTLDQYCEDALMTCFYYGFPCIGERNTEYCIDYFIKRGYAGYLIYLMDANGKVAPQPWVYSGGVTNAAKADMINFTGQHIENHVHNECHVDLLNEWKLISNPEDYHKKDLAAAGGWAIYGYMKGYQKKIERLNMGSTINLRGTWLDPNRRKLGNL